MFKKSGDRSCQKEDGEERPSGDKGWPNRVILGVSNPITLQQEMSCSVRTRKNGGAARACAARIL